MAKLIYAAIASLDGYIEDKSGKFDWAVPDEEVHASINDLVRPVGTYLYGRRLYQTMIGWETDHTLANRLPAMRDFAQIWQSADKIVYSKTLQAPTATRTRIERDSDPKAVQKMIASADRDIAVGGPNLAHYAFSARLVDECHLYIVPLIVGGGKQCLPSDVRLKLELLDVRHFAEGTVYLRYNVENWRNPRAAKPWG